jgi:hypothetical protein
MRYDLQLIFYVPASQPKKKISPTLLNELAENNSFHVENGRVPCLRSILIQNIGPATVSDTATWWILGWNSVKLSFDTTLVYQFNGTLTKFDASPNKPS